MSKDHQKYARGKTGEKLYSILNELIDISEDQQRHMSKYFYDNLSFAKEYCTIQLKTARQAGHTYALIETAITRFEKPVIVTAQFMMSQRIEAAIKEQRNQHQTGIPILATIKTLERVIGIGDIDAVFVDCAFMLSDNKKTEIYNIFLRMMTKDKPFFFIFVE